LFLSSLLNSLLSSLLAPALELAEDLSEALAPVLELAAPFEELLPGEALELLLGAALDPLVDDFSPANADMAKAAATAAVKRVSFIGYLLGVGEGAPCKKCTYGPV
jgi:hypothetical protein